MLEFEYGNVHSRNFRTKSKQLPDDLANLNLIKLEKAAPPKNKDRKFRSMKGLDKDIAEDFNAPLEDFKNYM